MRRSPQGWFPIPVYRRNVAVVHQLVQGAIGLLRVKLVVPAKHWYANHKSHNPDITPDLWIRFAAKVGAIHNGVEPDQEES